MDREKQAYDFESLQSQLDKALGQAARLQKERDTAQLDADRFHDKHDKAQVSFIYILLVFRSSLRSISLGYRRYQFCTSYFFSRVKPARPQWTVGEDLI